MKRSGFTMIELVFVIVILGILASVAIPKLAATRDDAMIAKSTSEIASLVQDMGSYYTVKGGFKQGTTGVVDITPMTNVKLFSDTAGTTELNATSTLTYNATAMDAYYVDTKRAEACLKLTLDDTNGTVNLVSANGTGVYCKGLVNALNGNGMLKRYTFGGSSIYGE